MPFVRGMNFKELPKSFQLEIVLAIHSEIMEVCTLGASTMKISSKREIKYFMKPRKSQNYRN